MYQAISIGNYNPTLRDLEKAGVEIFNDWWNTYIPEHKPELIKKIMHTYYFEQIGADTPEQFVHYINAHLERIMPYYNQLYASELLKINPMLNHSIEANGRNVENILKYANTKDDKYSKAIRDFVGLTDKTGTEGISGKVIGSSTKEDTGHDSYVKSGTEDVIDSRELKGKEDTTTHDTTVTDGTVKKTENETSKTTDNTVIDKTQTETPGEETIKKMEWGQTETGTEKVIGKDVSDGSGSKNWTETLDDDSTTKTVTDLDETSSSHKEEDYADTPQTALEVDDNGNTIIRKNYLTNVRWDDENGKHNADTTQDVTFADDQTKEHKETTTDTNTIDKTVDTDSSKTKGGTDTETTTKSGSNVTQTDETDDRTVNGTKDNVTTTKTDETVTGDGTKGVTSSEDETGTTEKKWTEQGHADNTLTSIVKNTTDNETTTQSSGSQQTHENADVTETGVSNQESKTEETRDEGNTTITSGFMNVSSSALLEAFRRTFLNIDSMIIEELRNNFMLVY